jgi:methylenetetrahydrofolate--tRNA-(uracil-5-)-methyltransferase
MGFLAGVNASRLAKGLPAVQPPPATAMGSLVRYITRPDPKIFQPMNVTFGLFPPLPGRLKGKEKNRALAERALEELEVWIKEHLQDSGPPG